MAKKKVDPNDPTVGLNARQRRFCEEYVIDFKPGAAVVRAGYKMKDPEQGAQVFLQKPHIRRYIDELTRTKEAKIMSVNPEYVVQKTLDGIDKSDNLNNMNAYFRGIELLARHLGMLRDKTEISGPDGNALQIEQKSKEDAAAVIAALKSMKNKSLRVVGGTDIEDNE